MWGNLHHCTWAAGVAGHETTPHQMRNAGRTSLQAALEPGKTAGVKPGENLGVADGKEEEEVTASPTAGLPQPLL